MNQSIYQVPSPIQRVDFEFGCTCYVKRDDLIHAEVSGNKYRKLKHLMQEAILHAKPGVITYGGAFSNHIYATAAFAAQVGLASVGVIRGEDDPYNPTLQFARSKGMKLHFVSRMDYKLKSESNLIRLIHTNYPDYLIIAEGGDHPLAVKGVKETIDEIQNQGFVAPDYLIVAAGTGTTAVGLLQGMKHYQWHTKLIMMPAIKSNHLVEKVCTEARVDRERVYCDDTFSLGGYAKTTKGLIDFIMHFYNTTGIPTDPIYTGKSVYGLHTLAQKGYFKSDDTLLWLHSGGLQGIAAYNYMQNKQKTKINLLNIS